MMETIKVNVPEGVKLQAQPYPEVREEKLDKNIEATLKQLQTQITSLKQAQSSPAPVPIPPAEQDPIGYMYAKYLGRAPETPQARAFWNQKLEEDGFEDTEKEFQQASQSELNTRKQQEQAKGQEAGPIQENILTGWMNLAKMLISKINLQKEENNPDKNTFNLVKINHPTNFTMESSGRN